MSIEQISAQDSAQIIERITGEVIDGLLIISFLTVLTLLLLAGRRRHITIAVVFNSTEPDDLSEALRTVSADFRFATGTELEKVRRIVRRYHRKVRNAPDQRYGLEFPDTRDTLFADQDNALASLLTAPEPGASQGLAAQLQTLGQFILRSRGATVTTTFRRPDRNDNRLETVVEVVSPGGRFTRSRLLGETIPAEPHLVLTERAGSLIQAAARCAAIDLATWVLQSRRFPFLTRRRRREGLARNTAGLLMKASSKTFRPFSASFLEFALDEFKEAAERLPRDYQPHFNLATAYETKGEATTDDRIRYRYFVSAVSEYQAAGRFASSLPEPARRTIQRKIMVRQVRTELISGIARQRQEALRWLREQRLKVELDCQAQRPHWPVVGWPRGQEHLVLNDLTADSLYNSACMYALATRIKGRADWDQHARHLLGTALAIEAAERDLWARAPRDPDLAQLSWHLPEFLEILSKALPDCPIEEIPLDETLKLVDDASAAAHWHAAPALGAGADSATAR